MTDPLSCDDARDLAPEVAIGVASAEDRARLVAHVGACERCATFLRELSVVVDDVVALAPRHEPPAGFESEVQRRLDALVPPTLLARPARRWRRLGAVAAVTVALAGASAGVVYRAHDSDRTLADAYRATLAVADGEYFAAAALLDTDGERRGVVFAYQGHPTWMFLTVDGPPRLRQVSVELVTHEGAVHTVGDGVDLSAGTPWGTVLPVNVHDVVVVRVLAADGDPVLSARVVP